MLKKFFKKNLTLLMVLISSVSFANYLNNSADGVLSTVRSYNYEGKRFDKEYFVKQKAQQQARFNSFFFPQKINNTFFATADECATAEELTVNTDGACTITTSGSFEGATLSGNMTESCDPYSPAVQDVWFEFEATDSAHIITVDSPDSWFVAIQVFSENICNDSSVEPLVCSASTALVSGLAPGETYKIRVLSTFEISSSFDICVRTLSYPENDECNTAINLPVNTDAICTQTTNGTFADATLSQIVSNSCAAPAVKDVWFEFEAVEDKQEVSLLNSMDLPSINIEVFEGYDCNASNIEPIACGQNAVILSGLTVGNVYKIRVSATLTTVNSTFDICVRTLKAPENDDCDEAIKLPVNETMDCEETVSGTFADATLSQGLGNGCDLFGKVPAKDVWYEFEALTSTSKISLSSEGNYNVFIEVYEENICTENSGPIACGSAIDPLVVYDLIPNKIYKVRIYSIAVADVTDFDVCLVSLLPPIYAADDEYTVPELVQEVLIGAVGECTGVENIDWKTGTDFNDVNGIAYFEKNGSDFPFEKGIVLSTGKAADAAGPSEQPDPQQGTLDWPGDQQLTDYINDALGTGDKFYNATVLEFDFTPVTDSLKFNFIFAANEYGGNFQCEFADAFAFFLTDTETGNVENLALVPNTTDPISVVTIRKEEHSSPYAPCEDENPEYFDKLYYSGNQNNGLDPLLNPINYKGRTVPMTAESEVVPGKTYHIKMVIQDRVDESMDSAVFLEGGSFDIGSVDLGEGLTFGNGKALCYGASYVLDTNLEEAFNFEWYKNDELIEGITGPAYTVTESGTYKVVAKLGNLKCDLESSIDIDIYPDLDKVIKEPKALITCGNTPVINLTESEQEMIAGVEGDYTFEYYPSLKDLQNGTNVFSTPSEHPFDGNVTTVFIKVIAFGENSCYAIKELTIDVVPVMPPMEIDDVYSCNGYKLPELPQGQRYYTGSAATGEELHAGDILREGTYTLYVYSESGACYEEHEFQVIVENCIIPKGISPNGDGLNDSFDLTDYYPTSVKIYNRYGTMVYEYGSGYTSEWYGQDKSGKELPTGTYFYKFTTETGEFSGYVYLTREL